MKIGPEHVSELISIESQVHYAEPPPPGREPFVVIRRSSPVLLSAPHGALTYRDNQKEIWHEEDEYTAGMALVLSRLCQTSVIATIWRTDNSDPNYHAEARSSYKKTLMDVVQNNIRWVIDLHGAGDSRLKPHELVDLGTRGEKQSLPDEQLQQLTHLLEERLGKNTVSHNHFAAKGSGTITAFCQERLHICSVQVEMKPAVRVPCRRIDASSFAKDGPFSAQPEQVIGMLQAIADFVEYLHSVAEKTRGE